MGPIYHNGPGVGTNLRLCERCRTSRLSARLEDTISCDRISLVTRACVLRCVRDGTLRWRTDLHPQLFSVFNRTTLVMSREIGAARQLRARVSARPPASRGTCVRLVRPRAA